MEPVLPPGLAMILPKGFVENTDEVYAEVAAHPVIPPDELYKYWKGCAHRRGSLQDNPRLMLLLL